MKFNYLSFYILSIAIIFSSCEKAIVVNLDAGTPQIAVDAFITDLPGMQTIKLTNTSPYFKNSPSPAITGAVVNIINENTGQVFSFTDVNNTGTYTWSSANKLAILNNAYSLVIIYNGDTLKSHCQVNPVPLIDSLTYEYKEGITPKLSGYFASFWGVDIPSRKDYYWIKSFRNDTLINEPKYMNISFDGAVEGWNVDGVEFFDIIRKAITPYDTPFHLNDSVRVQLISVNEETYHFLLQAQYQLTNAGLFAHPPANLPTNIINTNKNRTTKPVGWFVISAGSEKGITIK
jgi:hypothetical protein